MQESGSGPPKNPSSLTDPEELLQILNDIDMAAAVKDLACLSAATKKITDLTHNITKAICARESYLFEANKKMKELTEPSDKALSKRAKTTQ